ncbi:2-dehydropantoate 2-reductase [Bacillus sp. FJAT-42376]|uniref:2-dehydropantoate 2-reductase n=1 Tax=Bacillus sp. FJAT-42376 TaxID=2014076 RepID=UPI0013DE36CD|nr:2-dehydropantoate 2-reductase [Bacillus sp. FJAT-42376]
MKAGIIGGGAIGLLFAAYLSRNHQITLYTNKEEQASIIKREGVSVIKDGVSTTSFPDATSSRNYAEELLIVTVKQFQLREILTRLIDEKPKTILFLQNGMGHIKSLRQLRGHLLYTGSVSHGAEKRGARTVLHNGTGTTVFSPFPEGEESMSIHSLAANDFPFHFHHSWYEVLADKLLVNACINPLTALLGVANGTLLENPHYFSLLEKVFNEVFPLLNLNDPFLKWEHVQNVCQATASNTSSMLKDIQLNRKTEIEAIAGYILERAAEKNKQAPVVSFLYEAVKGMESS